MSRYIDIEKLIAEIERRIDSWSIRGEHSPAGQGKDTCESRVTELSDLLSFINSLQQEQPIGEEYAIEIGKHSHTIRIGSQSDIDHLIRQREREQPEVDFEKEWESFEDWMESYNQSDYPTCYEPKQIARHFYELGKAGKED